MSLLAGQCLKNVHLIKKKINLIIIEEILCKKLKVRAMEIIYYDKKDIIPLIQEESNFHNEQKICYVCEEKFCMDKDDENFLKKERLKSLSLYRIF